MNTYMIGFRKFSKALGPCALASALKGLISSNYKSVDILTISHLGCMHDDNFVHRSLDNHLVWKLFKDEFSLPT